MDLPATQQTVRKGTPQYPSSTKKQSQPKQKSPLKQELVQGYTQSRQQEQMQFHPQVQGFSHDCLPVYNQEPPNQTRFIQQQPTSIHPLHLNADQQPESAHMDIRPSTGVTLPEHQNLVKRVLKKFDKSIELMSVFSKLLSSDASNIQTFHWIHNEVREILSCTDELGYIFSALYSSPPKHNDNDHRGAGNQEWVNHSHLSESKLYPNEVFALNTVPHGFPHHMGQFITLAQHPFQTPGGQYAPIASTYIPIGHMPFVVNPTEHAEYAPTIIYEPINSSQSFHQLQVTTDEIVQSENGFLVNHPPIIQSEASSALSKLNCKMSSDGYMHIHTDEVTHDGGMDQITNLNTKLPLHYTQIPITISPRDMEKKPNVPELNRGELQESAVADVFDVAEIKKQTSGGKFPLDYANHTKAVVLQGVESHEGPFFTTRLSYTHPSSLRKEPSLEEPYLGNIETCNSFPRQSGLEDENTNEFIAYK